ncbi:MAG: serine/threonine-protein kinase [bacterium]
MKSRLQQRHGDLKQRLPTALCSSCLSVLYVEDDQCLGCRAPRPVSGWSLLANSPDPLLGRILGTRYLLTQKIGSGASAQVYRATSLNIAREFAIKLMRVGTGASHRERLDKEIEALSALRNPHFVTIYEVLELYDDYVALVMELAEGDRLDDMVQREGPMPALRAAKIARQIANGIAEAHAQGFVHRDLKPENIVVERMPAGDDFVRILDLGIVYVAGDPRKTSGGFLGSPLYASPEQTSATALDGRSDLYSLGAIFYFLLTGEAPFIGADAQTVLRAHKNKPVSASRIGLLAGPEAQDLVVALLAKDPNERPFSAQRVVEQLDAVIRSLTRSLDEESESGLARETPLTGTPFARNLTPVGANFGLARGSSATVFDLPLDLQTHVLALDGGHQSSHVLTRAGVALLVEAHHVRRYGPIVGASCIAGPEAGQSLVVGTDHGEVFLCQETAVERVFEEPTQAGFSAIAVSNNHVVVAGTRSGRVHVGRLSADVWERAANSSPVTAVAVSSDGALYAIARDTGLMDVRRVSDGKEVASFAMRSPARSVAFSNDGQLLVVLSEDGIVTLLQSSIGHSIIAIDPGVDLEVVRFDPQGQLLGYCRTDTGVRGVRLHGVKAV